MSYTAQELNNKVAFQRSTMIQDVAGDVSYEWTTFRETFAKVEPLEGREFFAAQAGVGESQAKVTCRWFSDLAQTDRIVIRGEQWNITSIQNIIYGNREMLIYIKRKPLADG